MEDLTGLLELNPFSPSVPGGPSRRAGDEYVPDGAWLMCDKGAVPGRLSLLPRTTYLYSENIALETDLLPFVNIPSFVGCAIKGACTPAPVKWLDPMEDGVTVNGVRPLLDTSKCQCGVGGKISIHLTIGGVMKEVGNTLTEVGDTLVEAGFWCEVGAAVLGIAGVVALATGVGAPAAPFLLAAAGGLARAGAVLTTAGTAATLAGGLLTASGEHIENPTSESGRAIVGAVVDALQGLLERRLGRRRGRGRVDRSGVTPDQPGGGGRGGQTPPPANVDPPGTFRDRQGRLRDSETGRYAPDPNRQPSNRRNADAFPRSMSERRRALLRDAEDPNSGLSDEARAEIRRTNGNRVPDGYEVSHEEPLYTRTTPAGKRELDVAGNMRTQRTDIHRNRHRRCGDQYHQYGPANRPTNPRP